MATITKVQEDAGGPLPPFDSADPGGDDFENTGKTVLRLANLGGTAETVTIAAVNKCSHGFLDPEVINLPAGSQMDSLVFPVNRFGRTPAISYSDATPIRLLAIERGRYEPK